VRSSSHRIYQLQVTYFDIGPEDTLVPPTTLWRGSRKLKNTTFRSFSVKDISQALATTNLLWHVAGRMYPT
jgi:hypothetical protein